MVVSDEVEGVVLIVEDDDAMRQTYCDLLADDGYTTVTAQNGAEGLAKLDELDSEPTLVVLDIGMPVIGGQDMLACLEARPGSDDLPVVVVTGQADAVTSLRARGVPVLRKPFDIAAFMALVHRCGVRPAVTSA